MSLTIRSLLAVGMLAGSIIAAAAAGGEAADPYPLAGLAGGTEETTATVREIVKRLPGPSATTHIVSELEATDRTLTTLEALLASSELPDQSLRSLIDRRQSWSLLDSRVSAVERTLDRRATALDADCGKLRQLEERWISTRAALERENAPPALAQRAESMIALVQSKERPAREAFTETLLLQDRAATQRIRVTTALEQLDAAVLGAQERLFAQHGQPLWAIFGGTVSGPRLVDDAVQTIRDKASSFREYVVHDRGVLTTLVLILAALLAIAFWIRSRTGDFAAGSAARRLVSTRPISSALLLALLIWSFGRINAPRPVIEVMVLALIAPLYRVLTVWLPRVLRPSLIALLTLVLLDRVRGIVSDDSWAGRLGMLVLSLGGLALIVWTLWAPAPRSGLRVQGRWIRGLVLAAYGVGGCLVLSTIGNVVGQTGFAELLIRGSLASLFLGTVLVAGTLVIEAWLELLTAHPGHATEGTMVGEAERLRRLMSSVTRALACSGWAVSVLTVFGVGTTALAGLETMLVTQWPIGSVSISLANVLGFALALLVGLTAARLLRLLLDHSVLPKVDLPRGVATAMSTSAQYVLATLAILVAIFALGIDASRFTILAGAVGVGVGFGLQNIVNNFVSGLILLYERPIQTGDTIELGTLLGRVIRIGVRSSTVRTFDGAEVIVPNATLISNEVTNWTLSDRLRRVEIVLGVAYGSDPQSVMAILHRIAEDHPAVLTHPEPAVLFQGFGDSSLDFSLRVWTADFDGWLRLRSELHVAVYEALAQAKIEIPFPQRDLHIRSSSPDATLDAG